jgi:hypothetical protein
MENLKVQLLHPKFSKISCLLAFPTLEAISKEFYFLSLFKADFNFALVEV